MGVGVGGGGVNVIQQAREKHPWKWEVSVNAVPTEACWAPPDHMQMFPELISSRLRRLKLANVNISQRGPTQGSAHSAFPSLAVISDTNDEQIFLKNVLFPISSSTLFFFLLTLL